MISPMQKEKYWRTVEATLVEIMGVDSSEAYQKVLKLRMKVEKGYRGESLDIAYHDEPINVAAALAGYEPGQFDYMPHNEAYNAIRERYMSIEKSMEEEIDELTLNLSQKSEELKELIVQMNNLLEKENLKAPSSPSPRASA